MNGLENVINAINYAQNAINEYKETLYKGENLTTAIKHAEYYINNLQIELDKYNNSQRKSIAKIAEKVKNVM